MEESKRVPLLPLIRLISGMILMFYAFGHLLNHAFGIVSIEAMEEGRRLFTGFWRLPVIFWFIPIALVFHIGASLWHVLQRKTYKRMGGLSWFQWILGFIIPIFLFGHITATRYVSMTTDQTEFTYLMILFAVDYDPATYVVMYSLLVTFVWVHSCIGMHRWLQLKASYKKYVHYWFSAAIMVPLLAFGGILSAYNEFKLRWPSNVGYIQEQWKSDIKIVPNDEIPIMFKNVDTFLNNTVQPVYGSLVISFLLFLFIAFITRFVLRKMQQRKANIEIRYRSGEMQKIAKGTTLLEASILAGIPHASVCGGNGRCSTCRSRIIKGMENLPPPNVAEKQVLDRIGASPNVRLACQIRPHGNVCIHPVLPEASPADGFKKPIHASGMELDVTLMFADLRGFTKMSDNRLPYDVVFILNQYFELMGQAIESKDGYLDKFIGDGIMAIFGIKSGPQIGAKQAIGAAIEMSRNLELLNDRLSEEVDEPLRIGIGLHRGKAIVGAMGYKETTSVTAIGSTVNTAARLEGTSKQLGVELVISTEVTDIANVELPDCELHEVSVRGREEPIMVYAVKEAKVLKPVRKSQPIASK